MTRLARPQCFPIVFISDNTTKSTISSMYASAKYACIRWWGGVGCVLAPPRDEHTHGAFHCSADEEMTRMRHEKDTQRLMFRDGAFVIIHKGCVEETRGPDAKAGEISSI